MRSNPQIKGWFSAHFHLSHDYEDSITFPGGNNRGSAVFAQTGVMTARSSRDGRRQSRLVRGNSRGFEVCTIDHSKGGAIRLDATVMFSDECEVDMDNDQVEGADPTKVLGAHLRARARGLRPRHVVQRVHAQRGGRLPRERAVRRDRGHFGGRDPVKWWYMKDGAVLGGHNGMIIEYDPSNAAPLGMVVSRDELENRRVAIIDDEWGGDALCLFDDETGDVTVVQPNEDGSYWRKVVRNKMYRMKEMRGVAAAKN